MSKLRLVKKVNTGLIFSLIFIFLINTGFGFENNIDSVSKVGVDKENILWQKAGEFSTRNRLNCKNVLYLEYAQEQKANSAGTSTSLAEVYLGRIAQRHKAKRRIIGVVSLAFGTLYLFMGILLLPESEGGGGLLMGSGVVMGGLGIWCLKARSQAEKEFDSLLRIEDIQEREKVGREALFSLADGAKKGRILWGIFSGIYSIYCFAGRPFGTGNHEDANGEEEGLKYYNEYIGSIFGAVTLYNFLVKSGEEKALQRYLKESGRENRTEIRLGIDPYGNGKIVLLFSF